MQPTVIKLHMRICIFVNITNRSIYRPTVSDLLVNPELAISYNYLMQYALDEATSSGSHSGSSERVVRTIVWVTN